MGNPNWLKIAIQELGVFEHEDPGENPRIVEYLHTCNNISKAKKLSDETAWCSAFINWVMIQAGFEGTDSATAQHWKDWTNGIYVSNPQKGDIVVFKRATNKENIKNTVSGHVGFYIEEKENEILVLGGNQNNAVNKSYYPMDGQKGDNYYQFINYIRPLPLSSSVI